MIKTTAMKTTGRNLFMIMAFALAISAGCAKEKEIVIEADRLALFRLKDSSVCNNYAVDYDSATGRVISITDHDQRWLITGGWVLSRQVEYGYLFTTVDMSRPANAAHNCILPGNPFAEYYELPARYGSPFTLELITWHVQHGTIDQIGIKFQ